MMRLIFAILVLVLSSITAFSVRAEENTIDGWGKLKFGMTVAQARQAEPRLKFDEGKRWKSDAGAVEIGGEPFTLEAGFRAERLYALELFWGDGWYSNPESCEAFYDRNARMLVKKYGTFDAPLEMDISALPAVKKRVITDTSDGSGEYEKFIYKEDQNKIMDLHASKRISDAILKLNGMFWRERLNGEQNVCWLIVYFEKDTKDEF